MWYSLSARTVLSRARVLGRVYASEEVEPHVATVRCPLLVFLGTNEERIGGQAELEIIRRNARSAARVDTRLIEGADHVCAPHEAETAAVIAEWAGGLL